MLKECKLVFRIWLAAVIYGKNPKNKRNVNDVSQAVKKYSKETE